MWTRHTGKDISGIYSFVAAHQDVEVDVGLGEDGHVWGLYE